MISLVKRVLLFSLMLVIFLSGCSNLVNIVTECPDAEISWVDVLKINDIKYEGDDEGYSEGKTLEKGNKIGGIR